ncbi:hypothetical protein PS2_100 [Serratia phage PS2]|uniref:Uncharacterized protein n=1 Tax=Serratia phage PS2 TaxID=1481112 RepID=A0A023W6I0_9CAUD|nr:hypothetical protein FF83_gp100 [Serratia phage PS2]AHY25347.1 hypothetical protein PS2_100 [Serratia phage PS2]
MARVKHSSELQPGNIVYHVYGCDRTNTKPDPKNIIKMIILGKPTMHLLGTCGGKFDGWESPFIKVKVIYENALSGTSEYDTEYSLHDMGIMDLGERSELYNLNRVFKSREEAAAFQLELTEDIFSDDDDAEFAKRRPAEQHLADREMSRLMYESHDYDYDYAGYEEGAFGDDE